MDGDLAFKRVRQRIDALPSEVAFEPLSRDAWLPYPLLLGRKAFFQSDFSHDPSGFSSKVHLTTLSFISQTLWPQMYTVRPGLSNVFAKRRNAFYYSLF